MRLAGTILAIIGLLWLIIAFGQETSVDSGTLYPARVENLGLIGDKLAHIVAATGVLLCGVVLLAGGHVAAQLAVKPAASSSSAIEESHSEAVQKPEDETKNFWILLSIAVVLVVAFVAIYVARKN